MTFNFDTYSADISNTPSILNSDSKFEDADAKFFAANLTTCAFLGAKYDSGNPQIEQPANGDPTYRAQVYLLTPNGSTTSKILAGFTWAFTKKLYVTDMYFGIFEFEKPAAGEDSKKITGIKTYKVSTDAISNIRAAYSTVDGGEQIETCKIGVCSNGNEALFGYIYDSDKSVSDFYLPPKSFFLDGKHASVTNPTFAGKMNAVGSNVYSFVKAAAQGD